MAREITINSYDQNSGDVSFTVTGAASSAMNRTYIVNNLPIDSKDNLIAAVRFFLRAYKEGLQAAKRPNADATVTAIIGQPQNDPET